MRVFLLLFGVLMLALPACGDAPSAPTPEVEPDPEDELVLDRTSIPPVPEGVDVVEHLAKYPGSMTVGEDGGASRVPKYGDYDIEQAEIALTESDTEGRYPRPWTTAGLLARLRAERAKPIVTLKPGERSVAAALITLLAAGRTPEGLAVVGEAIDDEDLGVRVAACMGIETYWSGDLGNMNLEMTMLSAAAWWKKRQAAASK